MVFLVSVPNDANILACLLCGYWSGFSLSNHNIKKYFTHARMDQGGAGPASNARKHRKVHVMHAGTIGRC